MGTGKVGTGADVATVRVLLAGHWYDALSVLLERALEHHDVAELQRARKLAVAARRVLDLDAEDFATIADDLDGMWGQRLVASSFPLEPRDSNRGALGSLVPLYELMLEVLELRSQRREPLQIVVTAHLIGEYLGQLAWEPTSATVAIHCDWPLWSGGSRWGTQDPECPHSSALRSTAKRALNACNGDVAGYTAYLDKFHSRQGDALAVCAMNHDTIGAENALTWAIPVPTPCAFVTRPPLQERRDLDARVRLALLYVDSPIVSLRHHAPVGHFFGVPSVQEISAAWERTWERVSQPWADGENPLLLVDHGQRPAPDEALPGMSSLISAVAGKPIGPGRLVRDIGDDIGRTLAGEAVEGAA